MGLAIKSAIEEGVQDYDLLHGDERYKFLWARDERELVRLELYPPRVRGAFYRRAMELRYYIKRMVRRRRIGMHKFWRRHAAWMD